MVGGEAMKSWEAAMSSAHLIARQAPLNLASLGERSPPEMVVQCLVSLPQMSSELEGPMYLQVFERFLLQIRRRTKYRDLRRGDR